MVPWAQRAIMARDIAAHDKENCAMMRLRHALWALALMALLVLVVSPMSGQDTETEDDTAVEADDPADAPEPRGPARRREEIVYALEVGTEDRYLWEASGDFKATGQGTQRVDLTATMVREVIGTDDEGITTIRTYVAEGEANVKPNVTDLAQCLPLVAKFDARHRLQSVEEEDGPKAKDDMARMARDLSSVVMYVFYSVPFHVRSARVGTDWEDECEIIDVKGRMLRLSGIHELIAFHYDGPRRVAVIESTCLIPVRGEIAGYKIAGKAECEVLSEVYIDTGALRYRRAVTNAELAARGGVLSGHVWLDDLGTTIRLLGPDGKPAEPLHATTDAEEED